MRVVLGHLQDRGDEGARGVVQQHGHGLFPTKQGANRADTKKQRRRYGARVKSMRVEKR